MGITTDRVSSLRKLVYAQAGRAVLCVLLRRRFHSVAVSGEGGIEAGLTLAPLDTSDRRTGKPDRAKVEREIVIDLAGAVANKLANERREWRGTGRDLLGAGRAIDLVSGIESSHEAARACLKYLWLRTRDLLEAPEHWAQVEIVAAALVDHRQLSAVQVRRLMRSTAA